MELAESWLNQLANGERIFATTEAADAGHMTETELEIGVDTDARKYHKSLRLPAKVDPSTTKATCTNGVLDITVQKVTPTKAGLKIKVD